MEIPAIISALTFLTVVFGGISQALLNLIQRVESDDLELMITAVLIQR